MNLPEFINKINAYSSEDTPFFFLADFELKKPFLCKLDETAGTGIFYDIKGSKNFDVGSGKYKLNLFSKLPVKKEIYLEAFQKVKYHLERGDTYLVNLTFPTSIETDLSLQEIFYTAKAPYKLLYKDEFLVFSPECFVRITEGEMFSYPMKGTIDASLPDAEEILLKSKKEIYEHNTIVDLIRNDISLSAVDVTVTKFRYLDKIHTNQKDLLQVSSEIKGTLKKDWKHNLGSILVKMLPAGSVSGAPKQKTVEVIKSAEQQDRGWFTGIFGIFDGRNLESAVIIRYIEKTSNGLRFRSGGGITALSDAENEYQELINKVYVPAG